MSHDYGIRAAAGAAGGRVRAALRQTIAPRRPEPAAGGDARAEYFCARVSKSAALVRRCVEGRRMKPGRIRRRRGSNIPLEEGRRCV
ncbi:hypothetical protein [Burkholderia oklahomensis]|uniref:hypothetical protein n=1 Tax=Burkholderia oklahomensis TaxID=342113 RepID=UPI0002EFC19F|nr:hypothetical protein [Burkholderia oklahomensis]